jgi:glycosyltransferase involved in cell wall biosynthesis
MKPHTKNICLFNSCKSWGGGEKWHYETAFRLTEKGYSVKVCCRPNGDIFKRLKDSRIKIHKFKIYNLSFLDIFLFIRLFIFFKNEKIYTLILGLPSDVKAVAIAAKLAGVKNIIYRRGTPLPVHNNILNRFIFKKVISCIIANSDEVKKRILENNSSIISESKIKILYNGIQLNSFDLHSNIKEEVLIGNAGRLSKEKGHKFLIDLAQELNKENLNFKILIAGKGPLRRKLEEEALSKNVTKQIIFLDFIEDIDSFLNNIDIFVLPSLHEGSANILIEAMAKAKPVVAFNISSLPEIISHGKTGYLAEFGNIQQMKKYVCDLAKDVELRKKIGMNAYEDISSRFDANIQFEKLLTLLN